MSYILEALKKSDLQRQRGATPTLQAAQITAVAPKRPLSIYYGLLAVVLLGAGIMIGWLHPWQPEQTTPETEPLAAGSPILMSRQTAPAPLAALPERPGKTAQGSPAANTTPAAQTVPVDSALKPDSAESANTVAPSEAAPITEKPVSPADIAQEQVAVPLYELPLQIQQEIPAMEVQLHAYSNKPGERLVSINSIRLREGGFLMIGLKLEQITPDGMIFSYKGYRFRRGLR